MNYKLKNGDKISSASIATVNVTIANTDLNDYTQDGVYYFGANYTPTNIPAGVNGWLKVMTGEQGGTIAKKQIWYRHGTANSNDFETYVRTSTDGSTWGNWNKYVTEVESGSNSNGKYIKYSDGTMICYNTVYMTKDITSNFEGSFFVDSGDINYPVNFITPPTVTATLQCQNALLSHTIMNNYANKFSLYIWKTQSKANLNINVDYIAIGRWK